MEPNNQVTATSPGTDPTPLAPKKGMSKRNKLLLIVGASVVGLILLIGLITFIASLFTPQKPQTQADLSHAADLYIARPGYDKTDGIGDAAALKQVPTNNVVSYGGTSVIQACNVLNLKDINDSGMRLDPHQDAQGVKRTYFDGNGAGSIVLDSSTALPFDDDTNSCTYYVQGSRPNNYVNIAVYQPTYVTMGAVDNAVGYHYAQQGAMHGVSVYAQQKQSPVDPELADVDIYILRTPNAASQVTLAMGDKDAKSKLLDKITANMAAAQTTPTPVDRFELQSPIFNGTSLESCSLLDNNAFRAVFNSDASPLVQERTGSAIGIIQHQPDPKKPGTFYNYTSSDCTRYAPARTYLYANRVAISTTTYETVEGAKGQYQFDHEASPFTANVTATPVTVGDESFYGDVAGLDHSITFRKGRVIVSASYDLGQNNKGVPDAQRMQTLMPLVQQMVTKLKGY